MTDPGRGRSRAACRRPGRSSRLPCRPSCSPPTRPGPSRRSRVGPRRLLRRRRPLRACPCRTGPYDACHGRLQPPRPRLRGRCPGSPHRGRRARCRMCRPPPHPGPRPPPSRRRRRRPAPDVRHRRSLRRRDCRHRPQEPASSCSRPPQGWAPRGSRRPQGQTPSGCPHLVQGPLSKRSRCPARWTSRRSRRSVGGTASCPCRLTRRHPVRRCRSWNGPRRGGRAWIVRPGRPRLLAGRRRTTPRWAGIRRRTGSHRPGRNRGRRGWHRSPGLACTGPHRMPGSGSRRSTGPGPAVRGRTRRRPGPGRAGRSSRGSPLVCGPSQPRRPDQVAHPEGDRGRHRAHHELPQS
ncbi:hypothetical protein SAMN05421811_101339 [Nonomuraea wenchangensis]|uniref:Uncharacterized protein n=1 Tax=Nonomuraea wenchangensis TaxID=568860 RepID=A0A1H9ZB74_9ACTN|nr:hypothetical protein SAMN05421811_101339 [Nonomuraea wenchangensis]